MCYLAFFVKYSESERLIPGADGSQGISGEISKKAVERYILPELWQIIMGKALVLDGRDNRILFRPVFANKEIVRFRRAR